MHYPHPAEIRPQVPTRHRAIFPTRPLYIQLYPPRVSANERKKKTNRNARGAGAYLQLLPRVPGPWPRENSNPPLRHITADANEPRAPESCILKVLDEVGIGIYTVCVMHVP